MEFRDRKEVCQEFNPKNDVLTNLRDSLEVVRDEIIQHGGVIAGLDDPKLTHVLYDKRDESRRIPLLRKTSRSVFCRFVVAFSTLPKGPNGVMSL